MKGMCAGACVYGGIFWNASEATLPNFVAELRLISCKHGSTLSPTYFEGDAERCNG
jgi:hypothetical protein